MRYLDCMQKLQEQGLQEEFCSLFEPKFSKRLLKRLKNTNRINSVASLLRLSLTYLPMYSNEWNRWVDVLQWFMKPEFERSKIDINQQVR